MKNRNGYEDICGISNVFVNKRKNTLVEKNEKI